MFEMLEEVGVMVCFNVVVIDLYMWDVWIEVVDCFDCNGLFCVELKMVFDCFGDGDILVKVGVFYILGDVNGNMMGVIFLFYMVGVDRECVFVDDDFYFIVYVVKGVVEGCLYVDFKKFYLMCGFYKNFVFCNFVVICNVDGINVVDINWVI